MVLLISEERKRKRKGKEKKELWVGIFKALAKLHPAMHTGTLLPVYSPCPP